MISRSSSSLVTITIGTLITTAAIIIVISDHFFDHFAPLPFGLMPSAACLLSFRLPPPPRPPALCFQLFSFAVFAVPTCTAILALSLLVSQVMQQYAASGQCPDSCCAEVRAGHRLPSLLLFLVLGCSCPCRSVCPVCTLHLYMPSVQGGGLAAWAPWARPRFRTGAIGVVRPPSISRKKKEVDGFRCIGRYPYHYRLVSDVLASFVISVTFASLCFSSHRSG